MVRAFSLLEVLAVVAIIAILSTISIVGVGALGIGSKRAKTGTIIEAVRQALALTAEQQGGYPSPAEHPLAGSAGSVLAPRFVFQRAGGGILSSNAALTDDPALRGVTTADLSGDDQDRLLLDDDSYADGRVPLLYGLQRSYCGVLGAAIEGITRYRRLPEQPSGSPAIADPDDQSLFPDSQYLVSTEGQGTDAASRTLDYVFSHSDARTQLARLGAIEVTLETNGAAIAYGRAWSTEGGDAQAGWTSWDLGRIRDPEVSTFIGGDNDGEARWITYRVRGMNVVDAWGTELLYSVSDNGVIRLLSAGADGVVRFDPGVDSVFQTSANAASPSGDDEDGSSDNVSVATGIDL